MAYDLNQRWKSVQNRTLEQDTREVPFSMRTNKQLVVVHQEFNHLGNKSPIIGSHVLYTTGTRGLTVVYILSWWPKQARSSGIRSELNCSSQI